MSIIAINTNVTGLVGDQINPRRCTMITTDNLATITAAGYLNNENKNGNFILPTDIFEVLYSFNANTQVGTYGIFQVTYSSSTGFTLVIWENPGDVLLPVVSGDFANFNGTTGQIKDAGYSPTNAAKTKVVMLNAAPTSGHVAAFTSADGTIGDGGVLGTAAAKAASNNALSTLASTAGSGFTIGHVVTAADTLGTIQDGGVLGTSAAKAASNAALSTVASTAGSGFTIGHLVSAADTLGTIQDTGVAAANIQTSALSSPDAISDLIWYDVTATAAALAAAGKVNIQVSSGSKQYKVRNIIVNYAAAGLSGGGGDRLLAVSDGTTVYNNAGITAALLGTPVNTLWGGTGNPVAGTVAQNTSSVAAANIFLQYAGGTTDYTTGQIVVSVLLQRVA